jgi:DNA (cytosine-5)-methyltransferase 1
MSLRVGSLFSGAGGFDLGLERAGFTTAFQCEWDESCQGVLRRHWPYVPKYYDVSEVRGGDVPTCDLIAFGSPCQDLSVAGKRAGLGGARSGLFFEAIRVIKELQQDGRPPTWAVFENVAGALTSNSGRDFAAVLDSMGELGALAICWRVLDAQWFGTPQRPVPQRRRRLFVVACFDPRIGGRPEVLPLGARVPRNTSQSGESQQAVAGTLRSGSSNGGPKTTELDGHGCHVVVDASGNQTAVPLSGSSLPQITGTVTTTWAKGPGNTQVEEGLCIPVDGAELRARRLTPRECERLQGWDDDWTRWNDFGDEVADTNRYRMIGNGVAAPVATWIGQKINEAHDSMVGAA